MPAGPGWLGVGAAPCHMVGTTWAWRGSDSWRVGNWRWPEPCSSQPALGLGAASCSWLRQLMGCWMRFGQPVGGMPERSGTIRQGRRYTLSTQTRRERFGPGSSWLTLLWRRPPYPASTLGQDHGSLQSFCCTKLSPSSSPQFLSFQTP